MARRLVLLALALAAPAAATTWQIDTMHSGVEFSIRHLMISNVHGSFHGVTGTIHADDNDRTHATIEASVDPATIDTQEAKRDKHLRSEDFLDTDRFKTATFRSTHIEPAGEGHWKVTGDLTLHGVTHPIVLDVQGPTAEIKFNDTIRAGAHATTRISRKDFGIVWNKALEGGGVLVGDEVELSVDVEASKQPGE